MCADSISSFSFTPHLFSMSLSSFSLSCSHRLSSPYFYFSANIRKWPFWWPLYFPSFLHLRRLSVDFNFTQSHLLTCPIIAIRLQQPYLQLKFLNMDCLVEMGFHKLRGRVSPSPLCIHSSCSMPHPLPFHSCPLPLHLTPAFIFLFLGHWWHQEILKFLFCPSSPIFSLTPQFFTGGGAVQKFPLADCWTL